MGEELEIRLGNLEKLISETLLEVDRAKEVAEKKPGELGLAVANLKVRFQIQISVRRVNEDQEKKYKKNEFSNIIPAPHLGSPGRVSVKTP